MKQNAATGTASKSLKNDRTFDSKGGRIMKKSLRGALLSGLVFPGLGQIALNQKARGMALIFIIFVSFVVMIAKGTQIALGVLGKINAEGKALDMQTITAVSERAVSASDSYIMHGAIVLIILCWFFGVIDAYRIGKKLDKEQKWN
jgi:hypothetical protein